MAIETYVLESGKYKITKDPDAVLDYTFDWASWLAQASTPADTISTAQFLISGDGAVGASISASSFNATKATAWITGGTENGTIALTCRITSAGGRIDDRTVYIKVKAR
jgi:hypothetical protein